MDLAYLIADVLQTPISCLVNTVEQNRLLEESDSGFSIKNNALALQNKNFLEVVLDLVQQITKINERQILMIQNQNKLISEIVKLKKLNR